MRPETTGSSLVKYLQRVQLGHEVGVAIEDAVREALFILVTAFDQLQDLAGHLTEILGAHTQVRFCGECRPKLLVGDCLQPVPGLFNHLLPVYPAIHYAAL